LFAAVKKGDTKLVSDLIKDGVAVDSLSEDGQTPLFAAIASGNLDMVRLLLWKDADCNIKNNYGWCPIHEAAKSGDLEICDVLLHKGANPNVITDDGVSPLHYLCSRSYTNKKLHLELLQTILDRGADVNHNSNANRETPLHYAVTKSIPEACTFLLEHGASVNSVNKRGYIPLHIAALTNNNEIIQVLLDYGADINLQSKDGCFMDMVKKFPKVEENYNKYLENKKQQQKPEVQKTPSKIVERKSRANQISFMGTITKQSVKKETVDESENLVTSLPFYHGLITREAAESLTSSAGDSYLLRNSSVRGCYALTRYNKAENLVTHFLVYPKAQGGFSIQDCEDTGTYANLTELVKNSLVTKNCVAVNVDTKESAQWRLLDGFSKLRAMLDNAIELQSDFFTPDFSKDKSELQDALVAIEKVLKSQ